MTRSLAVARMLIAALLLSVLACAQDDRNIPGQMPFDQVSWKLIDPPQQVPKASASIVGTKGLRTLYFWIAGNYAIGKSNLAGPFIAYNAPQSLSGLNYVQLSWTGPTTLPTSYDVLMTTSSATPTGACNCAVATNVSDTILNITSDTLSSYTVSHIDATQFPFYVWDEQYDSGRSALAFFTPTHGVVCRLLSDGTLTCAGGGTGCTLGGAVNTSIISDQSGQCYGDLNWIYDPGGNLPYVELGGSTGNGQFEIDRTLNGHNQTVFNGTWFDQQSQYGDGDANLITYDNSACQFSAGNPACDIDAFNIQVGNTLAENGTQALEADVGSSSAASNDLTAATHAATHNNTNPNKVVQGMQLVASSAYSGSKVFALELNSSGGVRPVSLYLDSIGGGVPHLPADGYHYDIWSENNDSSATTQISAFFGNDIILSTNAGGEATCTGNATNAIISSSILNGGLSYHVNDTFTVNGGTGGAGVVDAINPNGVVLNFHLTAAGTGYSDGILTTTSGGGGSGLTLNISVQPPARGRVHVKRGGAGVADVLEMCMKKSDDTYAWVTIVAAP